MPYEITTIANKMVNCYLVKTGGGFFMVDTGVSIFRGGFRKALEKAGCKPGDLKLVIITHGDFDHTGNGAYLRKKYGVKIAVHRKEAGAVERGDMLSNRKTRQKAAFRAVLAMFRLVNFRKFKPDIYLEKEQDLAAYGFDARVIYIPGHSMGSIGVVTKDGDLFCGDLLTNDGTPAKNSLLDDAAEMDASIEKLKTLGIKNVYPGHGRPFKMADFFKNNP